MQDDGFDGFEWDDKKSDRNLTKRHFDFEFAARVFDDAYTESEDRREYGEQRYLSTGVVDGILITVVWTPRGRLRRIITAWRATKRERQMYREHHP